MNQKVLSQKQSDVIDLAERRKIHQPLSKITFREVNKSSLYLSLLPKDVPFVHHLDSYRRESDAELLFEQFQQKGVIAFSITSNRIDPTCCQEQFPIFYSLIQKMFEYHHLTLSDNQEFSLMLIAQEVVDNMRASIVRRIFPEAQKFNRAELENFICQNLEEILVREKILPIESRLNLVFIRAGINLHIIFTGSGMNETDTYKIKKKLKLIEFFIENKNLDAQQWESLEDESDAGGLGLSFIHRLIDKQFPKSQAQIIKVSDQSSAFVLSFQIPTSYFLGAPTPIQQKTKVI